MTDKGETLPRFFVTKGNGGWAVMDSGATVMLFDGLDRNDAEVIAAVRNGDYQKARDFLENVS